MTVWCCGKKNVWHFIDLWFFFFICLMNIESVMKFKEGHICLSTKLKSDQQKV